MPGKISSEFPGLLIDLLVPGISAEARMNLKISSSYHHRGMALSNSGSLECDWARGGLEFALRPDLVASVTSLYRNQRMRDVLEQPMNLDR